ncbi:S-(hydroxymethyl)glutathione dehydrogenase/alcohol dehydrogenase [Mycetocola sp. BIGb0189]|uniref:Zn-dependent alcohol dehydrogenase n=1 Tax=Mycetocola sp. BIGb0189 TaxID=2940604 RepID=UPI0021698561|nr:Zn-dependent alcohol dehydrogenase [Mycetocola sp. BIGb0189]MCS4276909.1 S-(hydroxymethyl)glutathione dehydrogenase/alcohol dehydrogenase [Mycetocola sp. BIGb0189]
MKAAIIEAVGQPFVIRDVDIAEPIGREVTVQVKASGLCHSDLHVAENDFGYPLPGLLGHEISGIVAKIGPDVTEFAVGDHVVACLVGHCGTCEACRAGRSYECFNPTFVQRTPDQEPRYSLDGQPVFGFMDIGGFAEQVLVHENNLVTVNEDIPFDKAALLGCGVVTGAGAAINSAAVRVGDTVAVIGCGGVGLSAVQGAAIAGARRVIAIDLQPAKLELAKRFGATHVVNTADGDVVEQVKALTGGRGVKHSFEVIGLKATAMQAYDILAVGGTAYLIGMQKPGTILEIDPITSMLPMQKGLRGVVMGSTNFKHDVPMFADFYTQGRFNLDDLVSQTIALEDINEGYAELKKGVVARSVIVF